MRVEKTGNHEIKIQDRLNTKTGAWFKFSKYLSWLNLVDWNGVLICTVELGRILLEIKKKHDFLIIVNSVLKNIQIWISSKQMK